MSPRSVEPPSGPGLCRERVLDEALLLVDTEGLGALSMRRLARELGVEAMSLYNHVADKNALFAGMLDLVAAEFQPPEGLEGGWRPWVRAWMREARGLFLQHPKLVPLLLGDVRLGPNALRMIDSLFARLQQADFERDAQVRTWEILKAYLLGSLVPPFFAPGAHAANAINAIEAQAKHPNLGRALPGYERCDLEQIFDYGLEALVGGLKRSR
jgi:TetR/AcrR family tetracycline transcriptional repressor